MLKDRNAVAGRGTGIGVLCGILAAALCAPAAAGEVSLQGQAVFFKAKIGEVNTIVVTHQVTGEPGDPSTVAVKDSTAPIVAISPCTKNGNDTVVCTVQTPSFVSLDLGNKNDRASQTVVSSDQSLPMQISGGLGNDTLSGGFKADTIDGGPDSDVIDGDDGNDILKGGAGNDQIRGGRDADNIDGELGDDPVLDGGAGNDVIHGGPGNDRLTGGAGSDQLFGDPGNDTLSSRDGETDALDCGIGNDTVDRDSGDSTKRCR